MKPPLVIMGMMVALLFVSLLQAENNSADIIAVVNGESITRANLEKVSPPNTAKRRDVLDALIARSLILQSYYKAGGKIPESDITARVDAIIKTEYGGDRTAFERTLSDRGVSLATYRSDIAANLIISYMRKVNVIDKIPANLDEKARDVELWRLNAAWIDSLRKAADVKIYLPASTP